MITTIYTDEQQAYNHLKNAIYDTLNNTILHNDWVFTDAPFKKAATKAIKLLWLTKKSDNAYRHPLVSDCSIRDLSELTLSIMDKRYACDEFTDTTIEYVRILREEIAQHIVNDINNDNVEANKDEIKEFAHIYNIATRLRQQLYLVRATGDLYRSYDEFRALVMENLHEIKELYTKNYDEKIIRCANTIYRNVYAIVFFDE